MNFDLTVLRAVARLSRKGSDADVEALYVRCGGEHSEIRQALRRLEALGLITRTRDEAARLTLAGLAVGVAVGRSSNVRSRIHVRAPAREASPVAAAAHHPQARRAARRAA